jgi:hypothetical protein
MMNVGDVNAHQATQVSNARRKTTLCMSLSCLILERADI